MTAKFTFHRDRHGVHVYYTGMNDRARRVSANLVLNSGIEFDASENAVVPPVQRLSSVETVTQTVGYKNKNTGERMTEPAFDAKHSKLKSDLLLANGGDDIEAKVRAGVVLKQLEEEWEEEEQDVEKHTDYEFEIVDILYPADERLVPMRNYDDERINYFKIQPEKLAIKFARTLCADYNLVENESKKRGTFRFRWDGLSSWEIEGKEYNDSMKDLNLQREFIGDIDECRAEINTIEKAIRGCVDEWIACGKRPSGLTVGMVVDFLTVMEQQLRRVDSKIKTQRQKDHAINRLNEFRKEVLELGHETAEGLSVL